MDNAGLTSGPTSTKKALVSVALIALIALVLVLDMQRREAEKQLKNLSVRLEQLNTGDAQQNREVADRIIREVRKLISIPEDVEPTVATIIDVEALRDRNPFYQKASNGNHLIVTAERAILYDSEKNIILDVVPVQVQQSAPAPAAATQEAGE
ncbi:hypothetical protein COU78_03880 [Candidatus Peregrinibacteria bacterium CG10_big_fil_rev_8_21_14_0_10_49_24]|nr:MAG: hypothetical protein COV83_00500 [Candidatus Peregrinibacteria bacterium CG11_big_fil_rev_8_21_14_0_20_49_14]PIR50913.1 MAG: hypothetical protein COU78_03880 [Candidatus Peregrinibacteria bacterium CG10_big_fil_rev_8_21_14_0_10_49_24]PJA67338.1 MAG: hypothetical protein CO157_05095 [Candidatus Peregrinibacteria bacterium CG_4_9_14_3_um_filter_49_12]